MLIGITWLTIHSNGCIVVTLKQYLLAFTEQYKLPQCRWRKVKSRRLLHQINSSLSSVIPLRKITYAYLITCLSNTDILRDAQSMTSNHEQQKFSTRPQGNMDISEWQTHEPDRRLPTCFKYSRYAIVQPIKSTMCLWTPATHQTS